VAAYARTRIDAAGRAAQPMVLNAAVASGFDGGRPLSLAPKKGVRDDGA
jgi:hypothetical protein